MCLKKRSWRRFKRHPLLNATISNTANSNNDADLKWVAFHSKPTKRIVEWTDDESAEAIQPIDLRSTNGLRIVGFESSDSVRVTFQIHHACCDGLGACHFIDDVLIAYHNSFDESIQVEQRTVEPDRLKDRTNISRQLPKWTLPWRIGIGIVRTVGFLMRQPIRLHGIGRQNAATTTRNCIDHGYPEKVLQTLRRESSARVTMNDRLLSIAFETLFNWHQQVEIGSSRSQSRLIRIGIPVNLRGSAQRRIPAANVVSITYLDRTQAEVTDRKNLIKGINRQMSGIKARKSGTFVRFMSFLGRSRQLKKLIRSDRVFLSATFSNLGEIFVRSRLPRDENGRIRFANVILENVDIQGPVRSKMPVFFAVFKYAKRLRSSMAYDTQAFDRSNAGKLHQAFASRVMASVGEPKNKAMNEFDAPKSPDGMDNVDTSDPPSLADQTRGRSEVPQHAGSQKTHDSPHLRSR